MNRRYASVLFALLATACSAAETSTPKTAAAATPSENHRPSAPGSDPSGAPRASAPSSDPWSTAPVSAQDLLRRPLIWSIEKDGKTSYALGTMHMGIDPERLPKLVWDKLDSESTFAMETDLSDPSLADLMQRHDGGSVHHDLGADRWKRLEAALTPQIARGIDAMKPMVALTLLSTRGLPHTAPMDGVLLGRAQNQKKRIVYLEPASKEAAILEKWMDARALGDALDDLELGERRTKQMLDAYLAGDDQRLLAIADDEIVQAKKHGHSDAEEQRQLDEMLYDRNASWIEPIEKLHAAGGGFIAVGALHLIGKRSVLDLLGKRGYKVTRLTP